MQKTSVVSAHMQVNAIYIPQRWDFSFMKITGVLFPGFQSEISLFHSFVLLNCLIHSFLEALHLRELLKVYTAIVCFMGNINDVGIYAFNNFQA